MTFSINDANGDPVSTYAKWDEESNRWVVWSTSGGSLKMISPTLWASKNGWTTEQEYFYRYGAIAELAVDQDRDGLADASEALAASGQTGSQPKLAITVDKNILTNSALFVHGENVDASEDFYYGRPLPEAVAARYAKFHQNDE